MKVRCGQCVGCRLQRSQEWAVRIMHESQLHDENCFLTLTYDDEHVPENNSLDKKAFPKFMKRVRKHYHARKIRYFHCGEYGSAVGRPHYHACLFGLFPSDSVHVVMRGPHRAYRSESIQRLWPFGFHELGELTFESAQYVAKYCLKKVTGQKAKDHYERMDPETGELVEIEPEYVTMSRRPGIGREWYANYSSDVFPSDEAVIDGRVNRPPRYYYEILKEEDPEAAEEIAKERIKKFDRSENTEERLRAQEVCTEARLNLHGKRELDDAQSI